MTPEDMPSDAVAVRRILEEMVPLCFERHACKVVSRPDTGWKPHLQGVQEYEPGVTTQLLNFMYRYVSEVLQDAEVTASYNHPAESPGTIQTAQMHPNLLPCTA